MNKRTSLSVSPINFSNSNRILHSLKDDESEDDLTNLKDLKINTSITKSDNQIPNNKIYNKMLSSSVLNNKDNTSEEISYGRYGKKSNTLPVVSSVHSIDKRYSEVENEKKKVQYYINNNNDNYSIII